MLGLKSIGVMLALVLAGVWATPALAGQPVSYSYLLPSTNSVQENLGTQTLESGTYFVDTAEGITVAIGASTITVINDVPLGFAAGAINGPNLVFSGVDIASAAIDVD